MVHTHNLSVLTRDQLEPLVDSSISTLYTTLRKNELEPGFSQISGIHLQLKYTKNP